MTPPRPPFSSPDDEIAFALTGLDARSGHRRAWLSRTVFWVLTLALIFLFWAGQWGYITAMRFMRAPAEEMTFLLPRAGASTFGFLQSVVILAVQWRLRQRSLGVRAIAALGLAILGAGLHSLVNRFMFGLFMPDFWPTSSLIEYVLSALDFLWFYLALSAMLLAFAYAIDVSEREERINALRTLAHAAKLQALRNQLNPHFLFNTLNAITGLISRDRKSEAEQMTESLADFLRQTLALDPQKQITLGEEIQLQELYLTIEKTRFPDRLNVRLDIPEDLKSALVPSLITQPLIENSIKYAVARSSDPVQIEVAAAAMNGKLQLIVQDNGGNSDATPPRGARVGLANVAERLRLQYESEGKLDARPREEGGFRNVISMPLKMAG